MDTGGQPLLLLDLLEVDREFLRAASLASGADHLPGDLLGRGQHGLGFVLRLRLDEPAELPQALEPVLVHGNADMADNALSGLAAVAHALDESAWPHRNCQVIVFG